MCRMNCVMLVSLLAKTVCCIFVWPSACRFHFFSGVFSRLVALLQLLPLGSVYFFPVLQTLYACWSLSACTVSTTDKFMQSAGESSISFNAVCFLVSIMPTNSKSHSHRCDWTELSCWPIHNCRLLVHFSGSGSYGVFTHTLGWDGMGWDVLPDLWLGGRGPSSPPPS